MNPGLAIPDNPLMNAEEFTIIIDIGQGTTKIGYSGDEQPQVFPTIVGKPKFQAMTGMSIQDIYVGSDTERMRGVLKVDHVINRGNVIDWNYYYALLNHIFYNVLRIDTQKCNIIYLVPPLTQQDTAIYFARVLFETHQVKRVAIIDSASAAAFSFGETTALMVEIGTGLTHITPVMNGQLFEPSIQRLNLAGADIDDYLNDLMSHYGLFQKKEIIVTIKEKECVITTNAEQAAKDPKFDKVYIMPDGDKLKLNAYLITYPGEILFNPGLKSLPISSIPEAIIAALQHVDPYYWRPLLNKIILFGGTSQFKGLKERIEADLNRLVPKLGKIPEPVEEKKETPEIIESSDQKKLIQIKTTEKGIETCTKCGQLIHIGESRFCPHCGQEIVPKQINIIGVDRIEYPTQCPGCKKTLDGNSSFCPFCGIKLEPVTTAQDKMDRKDKKLLKETAASDKELLKLSKVVENEYGTSEVLEELVKITKNSEDIKKESEGLTIPPSDPTKLIRVILPPKMQYAAFRGASILGVLPSFQALMIDRVTFNQNPASVIIDYSKVIGFTSKK